jgi:hypothetical protein
LPFLNLIFVAGRAKGKSLGVVWLMNFLVSFVKKGSKQPVAKVRN